MASSKQLVLRFINNWLCDHVLKLELRILLILENHVWGIRSLILFSFGKKYWTSSITPFEWTTYSTVKNASNLTETKTDGFFHKSFVIFSKIIRQMKENAVYLFLIEMDFLYTCNHNAQLTTHNQTRHSCDITTMITHSYLNTPIDQWQSAYYPNDFIILTVNYYLRKLETNFSICCRLRRSLALKWWDLSLLCTLATWNALGALLLRLPGRIPLCNRARARR